MSASAKRWLWSWVATLFLAPFLFALALAAIAGMLQHAGLWLPAELLPIIARHANDSCGWLMTAVSIGYIAATPTLLIGAPAALALEENGLTSPADYALAGAVGGLIGGIAMAAMDGGWLNGRIAPSVALACIGLFYGTVAMLVFRSLASQSSAISNDFQAIDADE
jgi:hypothetical protein